MKCSFIILIALVFISCRRDEKEYVKMIVGDTTNMIVTYHDTIVQPDYEAFWYQDICAINLDNYGPNDIYIHSYENDISYPIWEDSVYYHAWVSIDNPTFSFAEVRNSGINYDSVRVVYDFYGTFPRKTIEIRRGCEPVQTAVVDTSFGTAQAFYQGDEFIDYLYWDNRIDHFELIEEASSDEYWNFSVDGDSLIGQRMFNNGICNPLPTDELFYLVFKQDLVTHTRYGWLELKITDHNAIRVSRSAITP